MADLVEIELDGRKVEVPPGSMVMHAAEKVGAYIPHFCYHKKLSIAASCRMCLVDVEKAPKALPACATPVTQGMIVRTKVNGQSRRSNQSWNFCWLIILWIVLFAIRVVSASCRIWLWATVQVNLVTSRKKGLSLAKM